MLVEIWGRAMLDILHSRIEGLPERRVSFNALFHHVGESFLLQYRPLIRLCESFLNDQPAKCDRKILMSTCDKRASIGAAVAPFANFGRQDPPPFCSGTRPM